MPPFFHFFGLRKNDGKEGIRKKEANIHHLMHAKVPLRSATKLKPNFSFSPPILWVGEADQDRFPLVLYIHITFGGSINDRPEEEGPLTANNAALCNNSAPTRGSLMACIIFLLVTFGVVPKR